MKRKRRNQRKTTDLRSVDTNSQAYWEEILAREDLRMSRGSDARLVYVGGASTLEYLDSLQYETPTASHKAAD